MGKPWLKLVPSSWARQAQHKQNADEHVTIRVSTLHLIIRETYNMGREDERNESQSNSDLHSHV
jgi:hypothetical protein